MHDVRLYKLKNPLTDHLHYQAQCKESGCGWKGLERIKLTHAKEDKYAHERAQA